MPQARHAAISPLLARKRGRCWVVTMVDPNRGENSEWALSSVGSQKRLGEALVENVTRPGAFVTSPRSQAPLQPARPLQRPPIPCFCSDCVSRSTPLLQSRQLAGGGAVVCSLPSRTGARAKTGAGWPCPNREAQPPSAAGSALHQSPAARWCIRPCRAIPAGLSRPAGRGSHRLALLPLQAPVRAMPAHVDNAYMAEGRIRSLLHLVSNRSLMPISDANWAWSSPW